ncbi:lipoprotein-releasing ABC transporter permease subunit [Bordetella genomosp. 13]|uniref:lipoprotein-releasing ABC transporter permease subunit n=1 Tax=Bordetella genomosp. 13 TaxID=463040 RepID=UPI0021B609D9|nr:lipoprotein-releasing ABC transporter permease subunit [Bordetella genomosp. 13]
MLKIPYELWVGARYAGMASMRGRRGRDRFVSFIAASSMAGIALGVAALIVVLSVMNGFQKEVRDRMLSVLPHIELYVPGAAPERVLTLWQQFAGDARTNPAVTGQAPFVAAQAMLVRGEAVRGVQVRGIDPASEGAVSDIPREMTSGKLESLSPGSYGVVLGEELAKAMNVKAGDTVLMLSPQGRNDANANADANAEAAMPPGGFAPRMRQFTVTGIFSSGHYEYDSSLAFVNDRDAAAVFADSGTAGVRLRVNDMQRAPEIAAELQQSLPPYVMASDWTRNNRTWFAAVQTQKRMMFLILALIVAVAAFNLLASLVMAVKDKRSDVAILRTLGARPGEIARIFLVQGSLIGVIGTALGVAGGILIAYNIHIIVPFIERLLGIHFLAREVYFINELPSDPQMGDILSIGLTSLALSLVATLYPSWRASRLQPAQVLRQD